ncbi:hypothetical protein [uncultured Methylophaga sp.]|uniref:hypothetical protein n=1 Tax=uncultured Methylophaga sp. TaxID=285271 RepID=UPI002614AF0A|nr:hypothetical protein [uncultured Methylophaga sp.]
MKNNNYIEASTNAILSFQMLEEVLKICIGLSYEIIQLSITKPLQFRFQANDINNLPLEQLVSKYKVITSKPEQADEIKKIIKWRNFIAHNAFRHEFLSRTDNSPFDKHSPEDITKVLTETKRLISCLAEEMKELQQTLKSLK